MKLQRRKLNQCGAVQFDISRAVLECYIDQNFKISEIGKILCVSESTIFHRIGQFALSKVDFSDIPDEHLDRNLKEITLQFPHSEKGS